MRFRPRLLPAAALLLTFCLGVGGCGFTENAMTKRVPKPGPVISSQASAVMPAVSDNRRWPDEADNKPISNIRIYSAEMTARLRKDLVKLGTFKSLVAPGTTEAEDLPTRFEVALSKFELTQVDTNVWVVPHLVLNGLALPLFGAGLFATGSQVDLGGYIFPSNAMSTVLNFTATFKEEGITPPQIETDFLPVGAEAPLDMSNYTTVLARAYSLQVPLFSMSGLAYMSIWSDSTQHGVQVGLGKGEEALKLMVETIARDPFWAYLPEHRSLARLQGKMALEDAPDKKLEIALSAVDLIRPLPYVPEEVGVLLDGYMERKRQAAIVNDLRCRWFQVAEPANLPPAEHLDAAKVEALFNNPALPESLVKANLTRQAFKLAFDALAATDQEATPPVTSKIMGRAASSPVSPLRTQRPTPALKDSTDNPALKLKEASGSEGQAGKGAKRVDPAKLLALRNKLLNAIAARFDKQVRMQLVLLDEADRTRGEAWQSMLDLLKKVDSPQVKAYLNQRMRKKAAS